MTTPIFPVLAGQGFSVHKKPTMSTLVASHVSGREVRAQLYQNPIWQFELPFSGLDGTASGVYGALGAQSMQSLMGLFLQCGGQFGTFVYYDPTDYAVTLQGFGAGDGTTTSFPLTRTLGGFVEDIVAPFTATVPALFSLPGSNLYAPNNIVAQSQAFGNAAWTKSNLSVTAGVTDPLGGTNAQTLTASSTGGYAAQTPGMTGNFVNSVWLRRRTGSGPIHIAAPDNTAMLVTLTGTWTLYSEAGSSSNSTMAVVVNTNGDAVDAFAAHQEMTTLTIPGVYIQTLASKYYGSPAIYVAGFIQDPTTYTIVNGIVTFTTAPAAAAALQWTGYFGFLCRFDDDSLDFDQFMSNLWQVESLKFRSVRSQ